MGAQVIIKIGARSDHGVDVVCGAERTHCEAGQEQGFMLDGAVNSLSVRCPGAEPVAKAKAAPEAAEAGRTSSSSLVIGGMAIGFGGFDLLVAGIAPAPNFVFPGAVLCLLGLLVVLTARRKP